MHSKGQKPRWWQIYAGLPLLVSLFLLEMRLPLTGTEHILAQLGILGLIYAFVHAWLGANHRALMDLDAGYSERAGEWRVRVYELPPAQLSQRRNTENAVPETPLFRFPEAGLKGVLSDTFELEMPEKAPDVFSERESAQRKE